MDVFCLTLYLLSAILANHSITRNYFGGVYPCYKLPEIAVNKVYVANVDDSQSLGSHCVAIFYNDDAYYFDSFGLPPIKNEFEIFLNGNSNMWYWSSKQMQGIGSDVCGHYCIHFLIHCCLGHDATRFFKLYPNRPRLNDLEFMYQLYKYG